ncbi:hypothetical protein AAC387_Pa05g0900 [Persea americana]
MMDLGQLGSLGASSAIMSQTQKDGSLKDAENEIPFHHSLSLGLVLAQNSLVKCQSSLGIENYGGHEHGIMVKGQSSFISIAENMNWGEAEHVLATNNCDVGGVCDVGIGLRLGDSMNDSNENCRRNGSIHIAESYEKKRAQKGKVIIKDPNCLPHEMGLSGHKRSRQRSNQTERRSSQNPLREGIGVNVSNSANRRLSINTLKEMLFNSGWVGVKPQNVRRKYYLSPSGSSYQSLPKAVKAFQQGTSERELDSSPLIGNREHLRNSIDLPPDLCSELRNLTGYIDVCKKKRSCRKRARASSKDLSQPRKQVATKDISMEGISSRELHGNKASCIVYEKGKSFPKYKSWSCKTQESDCFMIGAKRYNRGNKSAMQGKLRRSARINGKHVLVDCDFDIEKGGYDDYIDSFILFGAKPSLLPEKMRYTEEVYKASASCVVDEKVTSSIEDKSLSNKNKKFGCSRTEAMEITKTGQGSSNNLRFITELLKVTKPNEVHDSLASSSCVSMESSLVPKEVHEGTTSCTIYEKVKSSNKDESSGYEAEKLDCREEVETHNSSISKMKVGSELNSFEVKPIKTKQNKKKKILHYGESLWVRRSPRLSKNHILADGEFEGTVNKLAKQNEEKLFDLNIEPEIESESPISDKMLASGEKLDCREAGNEQLIKEGDNKCGTETMVFEKHFASSMSVGKAVRKGISKGKNKVKSRGYRLVVRRPVQDKCEEKLSSETKVTVFSWLIDVGMLTENRKVFYKGSNCNSSILEGWVTRNGIKCNCCMKVMSLLDFEAHLGSNLRRPWENTYLNSGKTLMQCWSEAWKKEKNQKKVGFKMVGTNDPDPSDDSCGVCADGGSLICCDNCPSTFHQDCLELKSLPKGKWYCPYCSCTFCMMVGQGLHESSGSFKLFSCIPCGRKYHTECSWGHKLLLGNLEWPFCGYNCEQMLSCLHVKKLIIPAISELLNTWMESFSFKPLEPSHKEEIRNLSMLVFAETALLQKPIYNKVTKDEQGDI